MEEGLEVRDLVVTYGAGSSVAKLFRRAEGFLAINHVDLVVPAGHTVGLVGGSGCGKSTMARVIAGLTAPTSGSVALDGEVLPTHRSRTSARDVQMVFQDPSSALNPLLTVRDTLTELLHAHRMVTDVNAADVRVLELLGLVGLPERVLDERPRVLSGGQRQRVSIARALALEPRVLIADEAVSALDVSVQAAVLNTLRRLKHELGLTMLFISHDLAVTRYLSDSIAVMHAGQIVERGNADHVLNQPMHEYTQELVRASEATKLKCVDRSGR